MTGVHLAVSLQRPPKQKKHLLFFGGSVKKWVGKAGDTFLGLAYHLANSN